MEQVN